jgi:putative Holliday junction resolvase
MADQIIKRQITKPDKNEEVLLGIDYGEAKIGLAFGRNGNAMPIDIIKTRDFHTAIKHINDAAIKNSVTKIIVGLPLSYDSKETVQSHKVRSFVKLLKHYLKLPVEFVNEFGSSADAQGYLLSTGASRNRSTVEDDIAAALILKEYYNQQESKN